MSLGSEVSAEKASVRLQTEEARRRRILECPEGPLKDLPRDDRGVEGPAALRSVKGGNLDEGVFPELAE